MAAYSLGREIAKVQLKIHGTDTERPEEYKELALLNAVRASALAEKLELNIDPLKLLPKENPEDIAAPKTKKILADHIADTHNPRVLSAFNLGFYGFSLCI